ncbi:hypothetical protein D3C81_1736040 [compost metagenome]
MGIQEQIDAVLFHLLLDEEHLGTDLLAGVLPGPVQILAHGVGAQMAMERAVRIHVRYQVQIGTGEQLVQHRIIVPFQALDHAFHEPFGHVLAGMLLSDDPDFALAFGASAFAQQLNVATFDTFTGRQ